MAKNDLHRRRRSAENPRRVYSNEFLPPPRVMDRPDCKVMPIDAIGCIPKKRGRKPVAHDLANYCCPRCKTKPAEKSKHKNLCRPCYNADYNKRTKAWYAQHRAKGYGKQGRPTGPPPDRDVLCPVSASWLSRPLTTPSRADPN